MRLILSDSALADCEGIMDFIGRDNQPAAVRFGEGLIEACELLEQYPELVRVALTCSASKPCIPE